MGEHFGGGLQYLMPVNPHISEACATFGKSGQDFHEVISWHLLHGIVTVMPEFLCLGYFCGTRQLDEAVPLGESDCLHISYLGGDVRAALAMAPAHVTHVVFERGFRQLRPARAYPLERIKDLLTSLHN